MTTYLITGTSRGLGLTLVKHLLAATPTNVVIATARSLSPDLSKVISADSTRVHFVELDITDEKSVKDAVPKVETVLNGEGLDVLVNNAGIMNYSPDGIATMTDLESTFKINVAGVHYVTSALLPLLRKGSRKEIVNISTTLGTFSHAERFSIFPVPAYKVSKAALNMLTVQYAQDLAKEEFTIVALSPGWIKTDLGSQDADLTVDESAKAVLEIVHGVSKADNGKFFNVKVPGWEKAEGLNQYAGGSPAW